MSKVPREELLALLTRRGSINPKTLCIEYQGARQKEGYGMTTFSGKKKSAHRLSWELHHGEIPEGLFVLHKCDNPPCFNPDHLFLGTKRDNRLDQIAKGRDPAKAATKCKRGHEFNKINTIIQSSGRRQCGVCKEFTQKRWRSENKYEVTDSDEITELKAALAEAISIVQEFVDNTWNPGHPCPDDVWHLGREWLAKYPESK